MDKQTIASATATPAIGPYSPALAVGNFVFLSGQIALDHEGKIAAIVAADQARKALENMTAQLAEACLGELRRHVLERLARLVGCDDGGDLAFVVERDLAREEDEVADGEGRRVWADGGCGSGRSDGLLVHD